MRRRHGDQASSEELPLSSIRVLFRAPDALTLWGIPYEMRPGQAPRDLWRAYNEWTPPRPGWYGSPQPKLGWIYLGEAGWFGSMRPERKAEVKAFLAKHKSDIPGNPYEWVQLSGARPTHGDRRTPRHRRAYAVDSLVDGDRIAIVPAHSIEAAVRGVARSKGISRMLLRGRPLR